MYTSSIKSSSSEATLPCSYLSIMDKSSILLKKIITITPSRISSTTSKHIPITIPAKLTQAQKEAALPFLTQEPPKPKTSTSKAKALSRFFKKLAKVSPTKDCLKSSSSSDTKKKTQYKLTFIPIVKKNESTAPSKADTTEIVWYDSSISNDQVTVMEVSPIVADNSAAEYAQRIWDEDTTVYSNLDHVVEWIGNGKEASNSILESYMSHFDFTDLKLEQAFRSLCSKLHLKGETQQIDRVLFQFSARFFQCNTKCIFGSIDVVHAIVYSLLLLNTDLHVAQGDYKKMSQVAFVKNTMNAISTGASSMFENMQSLPLQRTATNNSDLSTKSYDSYAKNFQTELKQMYMNIRHNQIANPSSSPIAIHNNRVSNAFKRSVGTIIWKNARDSVTINNTACETTSIVSAQSAAPSSVMQYQAVASHLQNTELPTSYTSNAPYYKEGMVVRKNLLENTNQKAKHRDWKECFMVIERSQLRMYKLDSTSYPKRSRSHNNNISDSASQVSATSEVSVVGGGNWMSHAQLIGAIDLKHTLSNALPSGYSRQRKYAFTLQQSNGAVSVFQVGSAEQVHQWVSTCNYWAARESKEPLVGGISSMEYGWGICLEALAEESNSAIVHEWQTPACPSISSMLEESSQLEVLHKHVQELSAQLDQHRDVKPKMDLYFSSSPKYNTRAMINYENKSRYLLHEIIKYQNYCNSIEKSLALQANLMASSA